MQSFELNNWYISPRPAGEYAPERVSDPEYAPREWIPVAAPSTLLGAMVKEGICKDPRQGVNLKSVPGFPDQETLDRFALREMPVESPFRESRWWLCDLGWEEGADADERARLILEGVNYRAELFINGRAVPEATGLEGSYRRLDCEISSYLRSGTNRLALKISPPQADSLAFSFVDWHPMPPDKCTGIWRPARICRYRGAYLSDLRVETALAEDNRRALISLSLEIENPEAEEVELNCSIASSLFSFETTLTLPAGGRGVFRLEPEEYPTLRIENPPLWWPWTMGEPRSSSVRVEIRSPGGAVSSRKVDFGIREITSRLDPNGVRHFLVNGRPVLVRGAAWAPDMLLEESAEKDRVDIDYLKQMNLNALRFEANFGSDYLWDLCDREGILIFAGWTCDAQWEEYDSWNDRHLEVAAASLSDLLRRFRNHPSLAAWFYGSDLIAPPAVERVYLDVLKKEAPRLVSVASAGSYESPVSGPTGVKMTGPYSYVPPVYWYTEEMPGVARGFNTETGPDVSIPPYKSLLRIFSDAERHPESEAWRFHSGLRQFRGTEVTENAIRHRYGEFESVEEFARIGQVIAYESWRAMYEAYARFRPESSGVIGWMLSNAWPSMIWHLYDSLLFPTGGFYGTRKACEPVHIQYDYKSGGVWAVNMSSSLREGLRSRIEVYSILKGGELSSRFTENLPVELEPDSTRLLTILPKNLDLSRTYLLFLHLDGAESGENISRNVYWLSTVEDQMTDKHVQFGTTEVARHGDMRLLRELASPRLATEAFWSKGVVSLTLRNTGKVVAFGVSAELVEETGSREPILPVLWSDNILIIAPGEEITITAEKGGGAPLEERPFVELSAWGMEALVIHPV